MNGNGWDKGIKGEGREREREMEGKEHLFSVSS